MASYGINVTDTAGAMTVTVFRAPSTAASGGTQLTGGGSNLLSAFTSNSQAAAIEIAKLVVENDRATNG